MATTRKKPVTIQHEDVFLSDEELMEQVQARGLVTQQQALPPPAYDDEDMDAVTSLNTVLAELGVSTDANKGFINIYKEKTVNAIKSEEYIGKFSIVEFANGNLLDHLQSNFGGGKYHISVYSPGGRGMIRSANKFIDIAGEPKSATSNTPQTTDLTPILATMQAGFEKMFTAMTQNQPKPKTTAEMLDEMRLMREIFAPASAPVAAQPVNQLMDAMKMGMEMAAMNGGGDGNNAWAMKMLDMFGKPVMDAIVSGNMQPARTAPRAIPAQVAQPNPIQPAQQTNEEEPMSLMMKGYIKMLNNAAAGGQDVAEYADGILNLLPSEQIPEFEAMLRAPDWQAKLASYSSGVNEHPLWYGNLRTMILEFIEADRAEANAHLTEQNTGDSVNAHENDNTGKPASNDNPGATT